jgi:hypothetical protein
MTSLSVILRAGRQHDFVMDEIPMSFLARTQQHGMEEHAILVLSLLIMTGPLGFEFTAVVFVHIVVVRQFAEDGMIVPFESFDTNPTQCRARGLDCYVF